jgi:hypothetical protein
MRRTLTVTTAPILRSFSRIVPAVALASSVPTQGQTPHRLHQHVGERGEPQAQHGGGAGAVGIEIELALLDAVLHLAARAVDALVKLLPDLCSRVRSGLDSH